MELPEILTLHVTYTPTTPEPERFFVTSSRGNPGVSIADLGCSFEGDDPETSIKTARMMAATELGVDEDAITLAEYLLPYMQKDSDEPVPVGGEG